MLQSEKSNADANLRSNLRKSAEIEDLSRLRKLLLGREYNDLLELHREFSDPSHTSQRISQVISEAIALRTKQDNSLTHVLAPSVEEAIHTSVKRDPRRLANALFPVIGPAIRESVAETFSSMMQQVNQLLENSLSARSIKWRIDALRTNRTFAEVMLTETVLYQVEQVFLVHRESSLLINHITSKKAIVKDPDMVSGMLTAVTDFVKDSFDVDKQQNVKSIKFGQLNLLFEAGPYAIIVAAVRGITPQNLQITMREQIEELHRLYGMQLETYDGNPNRFPNTDLQLYKCLLSKSKKEHEKVSKSNIPWSALIAVCLLLGGLVTWFIASKIEQSKWNDIVQSVQQEPGIIVLNHGKHDGSYFIKGLRDAHSKQPQAIEGLLAKFNYPVKWQWQEYISNEAEIVKQRINTVIDPPPSVKINYQQGKLSLSGKADIKWIIELANKLPFISGVQEVDQSGLRSDLSPALTLQQLIGALEEIVLYFQPNIVEVNSNQYKQLSKAAKLINKIDVLTKKEKNKLKIGILGFADASGTIAMNNKISERRARNVQNMLVNLEISEEILLAKGLGEFVIKSDISMPVTTCATQRCVIFEVYK